MSMRLEAYALSILIHMKAPIIDRGRRAMDCNYRPLEEVPGQPRGYILSVTCLQKECYEEISNALQSVESFKAWVDSVPATGQYNRTTNAYPWDSALTATEVVDEDSNNYYPDPISGGFCKKVSCPDSFVVVRVLPVIENETDRDRISRSTAYAIAAGSEYFIAYSWMVLFPNLFWVTETDIVKTTEWQYDILNIPSQRGVTSWNAVKINSSEGLSWKCVFGSRYRSGINWGYPPLQRLETFSGYRGYEVLTSLLTSGNKLLTLESLGVDANLNSLTNAPRWLERSRWRNLLLDCVRDGVTFLKDKEEVTELVVSYMKKLKSGTPAYNQAQDILDHVQALKVLKAAHDKIFAATGQQSLFELSNYRDARLIVAQPSLKDVAALHHT